MNEVERSDLIAKAYQAARKLYPSASPEMLRQQTTALANEGFEHIDQILGGQNRAMGLPSVGLETHRKPEISEDQAIQMIEEMTPEQRRTLDHIRKMRAKNQVPLVKGMPLL